MLFLFRSAPEVEKRIHSKLFRKFWRSRGTKEPAYITVVHGATATWCACHFERLLSSAGTQPDDQRTIVRKGNRTNVQICNCTFVQTRNRTKVQMNFAIVRICTCVQYAIILFYTLDTFSARLDN